MADKKYKSFSAHQTGWTAPPAQITHTHSYSCLPFTRTLQLRVLSSPPNQNESAESELNSGIGSGKLKNLANKVFWNKTVVVFLKVNIRIKPLLFKFRSGKNLINVQPMIDIGELAATKFTKPVQKWGLSSLSAIVLKRKLEKPKEIRTSNWELYVLTEEQIMYAAKDAYAFLNVYQVPDQVLVPNFSSYLFVVVSEEITGYDGPRGRKLRFMLIHRLNLAKSIQICSDIRNVAFTYSDLCRMIHIKNLADAIVFYITKGSKNIFDIFDSFKRNVLVPESSYPSALCN
ncbi:Werner Syndrome-like exonuclease [Carex littledalei]|uniref:3'-5' exonuclease n=1 Tax=Carex littledalei TaxID=544730 RepID=A0A833V3K1_9POAL|nr:Werner Syndrome-like exonuclease [Carex littledalei]